VSGNIKTVWGRREGGRGESGGGRERRMK